MPSINTMFPSNYLRAADISGHVVRVVMERLEFEPVEQGRGPKPVLYFRSKTKGIVLNKTNANNIAQAFGDNTDGWMGQAIELFTMMVDFKGQTVEAIRVRVPRQPTRPVDMGRPAPRPEGAVVPAPSQFADDLNDEIPF